MRRLLVLLAAPLLATGGEEGAAALPYVTLAGARSRIEVPEFRRLATAEELREVWLRHVGTRPEEHGGFHNEGVPTVDFRRCMVVAAFGGKINNATGFYAISLAEEADRVVLRLDRRCVDTPGQITSVTPFGFFFVPRSRKPLVVEEDVGIPGGTADWKERARFDALAE